MKKGSKLADWKVERLGDVCEVNPRRPMIDRPDSKPTTFVPMAAVDDVDGIVARPEQRLFSSVKKGYTFFTENDVIFAKITPCMQNGKQAIARNLIDGIGFGSTEFHVIRPNEKILAEWIWYFVRQPIVLETATKFFTGTVGQQRVPDSYLKSLEIPVPPLPEQQRIVSVLDEAFESISQAKSNAERNLVNARELFDSYLHVIFETPGKNWETCALDKYVKFIDYRGHTPTKTESGMRLITAKNVKLGFLQRIPEEFVDPKIYDSWMVRGFPVKGDVLFTTEAPLANIAQLDTDEKVLFAQRIIILQPQQEKINQTFLKYLLLSQPIRKRIFSKATGATVQGIKARWLKPVEIYFPPLAEQRAIVGRLEALSAETGRLEEIYQQKVESLEELKKSVLRKAFAGEL